MFFSISNEFKKINSKVIDCLWEVYSGIRNKDYNDITDLENSFISDFRYWDKGDCSQVGAIKLYLLYVAIIESLDEYRVDEYKDLIKCLKNL